ncbi:MAG: P-loop NTPase, partial [Peptococcus niger]
MSDHNNCSHNCSSCASGCPSGQGPQSLLKPANQHSKIKKVVGVISGKGGVGKSLVTALLATAMQKKGHQCAILDADITGPSIPRMFGLS